MAGHSKWANIKHKKEREDARRGKLFTKLSRQITVAVRESGPDPAMNSRLRLLIEQARAANMPMDNIERAIKRGTGELEGVSYEELVYEGYGPGGVAILLDIMTDNRNRTASEIRHLFSRYGGSLGETGSVAWIFSRKGVMTFDRAAVEDEDAFMLEALEAGAEDVIVEDDFIEVHTEPGDLHDVREKLAAAGFEPTAAEPRRIPSTLVQVDADTAEKLLKLLDALEDHDDVQSVSANFDMSEEVMQAIQA
ncbi:MAG: YebC/PmpR family DNA-binding transcriptional regulator [Limnochordales bacterium]|nr:MAG: YebC/PmpR family DNA-binding transcriptional regulator [Bacillota bacterium]